MEKMNNLTYSIKINYINESGLNVSISRKMFDTGLEKNSIQIGNISISEETINGRILSGRYDCANSYCGYKYDYEKNNHEYLININEEIPIGTAVNLINKTKMQFDFLSARMVLSSILREDYRVLAIKKSDIYVTKTAIAENEKSEQCFYQERLDFSKLESDECFSVNNKEIVYKVNNKDATEDKHVEIKLKKLIDIVNQNPYTYKDLLSLKANANTTMPTLNI